MTGTEQNQTTNVGVEDNAGSDADFLVQSKIGQIDTEIAEIDRQLRALKSKLRDLIKRMYETNHQERSQVEEIKKEAEKELKETEDATQETDTNVVNTVNSDANEVSQKLSENEKILNYLRSLEQKGELNSQEIKKLTDKLGENETTAIQRMNRLEENVTRSVSLRRKKSTGKKKIVELPKSDKVDSESNTSSNTDLGVNVPVTVEEKGRNASKKNRNNKINTAKTY